MQQLPGQLLLVLLLVVMVVHLASPTAGAHWM
jgi:hypothetical protein